MNLLYVFCWCRHQITITVAHKLCIVVTFQKSNLKKGSLIKTDELDTKKTDAVAEIRY